MFAALFMFGNQLFIPVADVDHTDHMLILGGNPAASNGSLMTAPNMPARLKAIRERGGKVVLFDPRRTETARLVDEHHFVKPGTDALLMMAWVNVLFTEELIAEGPWSHYVKGLDVVREVLLGRQVYTMFRQARDRGRVRHRAARQDEVVVR